MKNFKKIGIVIVVAAIFGFMMSVFIHTGLWEKLFESFRNFSGWWYLLFPVLIIFLTILIHELGHLISFRVQGIKIRALFIFIFVVYKNKNNKLRATIYLKNAKLIGGFVVPNLPNIESDQAYDEVRRKFVKALIDGPIASVIYYVLTIVAFVLVWIFTVNYFLIALLCINFLMNTFLIFIIMKSSQLNTDNIYGDFVAYRKMKNEELFALAQINQYNEFSLIAGDETEKYLNERIVTLFKENNVSRYNIFTYGLIAGYISSMLDEKDNYELDDFINGFNISMMASSKHGREVAYLISAYYYKNKNVKKAYEIYELINKTNNRHLKEVDIIMLEKQYEHLLNLSINDEYFEINKDQFFKEFDIMAPIIDIDKMYGDLFTKLPFVSYETIITLEDDENIEN